MPYEHLRPELRVSVEKGIINAPAGVVNDGGTWHVFTQYRETVDAGARWAHNVRPAGLDTEWEMCDDVLAPQDEETSLRAGCAVTHDGVTRLYFTRLTPAGPSIHVAAIDGISRTVNHLSDDPHAVDSLVERRGCMMEATPEFPHLRSPWVVADWRSEHAHGAPTQAGKDSTSATATGWMALCVAGPEDDPTIVIGSSADDPESFTIEGALTFNGDPGFPEGLIVSPKLLRLEDEVTHTPAEILLLTVEKAGEPDQSGYIVGTLTGTTFTVERPFTRIDYGHDFTRPRTTTLSTEEFGVLPKEALVFGLMNNVSRGEEMEHSYSFTHAGWSTCLTLARLTTLQNGRLFFTPSAGLVDHIQASNHARAMTLLADIPRNASVAVEILDDTNTPQATITHTGDSVVIDRSINPLYPDDAPAVAPLDRAETSTLTIVVDGSCVEVFADGGAAAMSSRLVSEHPLSDVRVTLFGSATIVEEFSWGPWVFDKQYGSFDDIDDASFNPEDLDFDDEDDEFLSDLPSNR